MNIQKSSLSGRRILVTGGTGFIGGHLVLELLNLGAEIVVVDIKLHPYSLFSFEKLEKKVQLVFEDIRDKKKMYTLFKKYLPTYIYHLAAEPIVQEGYKNPYATFETNIMGTINILGARHGSKNY